MAETMRGVWDFLLFTEVFSPLWIYLLVILLLKGAFKLLPRREAFSSPPTDRSIESPQRKFVIKISWFLLRAAVLITVAGFSTTLMLDSPVFSEDWVTATFNATVAVAGWLALVFIGFAMLGVGTKDKRFKSGRRNEIPELYKFGLKGGLVYGCYWGGLLLMDKYFGLVNLVISKI